ncbi:hypothetical protein EIP91_006051, partial [Steccherinum ochraceum]
MYWTILPVNVELEELVDAFSSWDAYTISTNSTLSSARGIPLGSVTGKAIMAVGNFIIKGVTAVDIQFRLRRIASQLSQEDENVRLSNAALHDLLEFQRIDLYPDSVRRRAMQLAILVMCRRRPYEQFVAGLVEQPDIEVRLFLQQMCTLTSPDSERIQRAIVEVSDDSQARETSLAETFRKMVLTLISTYLSVLLDSATLFAVVTHSLRLGRSQNISFTEWEDIDLQRVLRHLYSLKRSRL